MTGRVRGGGLAALAVATASLASIGFAGSAGAAGFQLKEQSASGLGTAFASNAAGVEDASIIYSNPAGIGFIDAPMMITNGVSGIFVQSEVNNARATSATGTPLTGDTHDGDVNPDAAVPNLYGMFSVSDDFKVGFGINTVYGLKTDYARGWVGRYHAVESEILSFNFNPVFAYKPFDWLSIGAGAQVQYLEANLSQAVDMAAVLNSQTGLNLLTSDPATDAFAELSGWDFGFGYTVGMMIEPFQGTRIGLSYRSEIEHDIDGDVDFTADPGLASPLALPAIPGFPPILPTISIMRALNFLFNGVLDDQDGHAFATVPAIAQFGIYQEVTDDLALVASATWTEWSTLQELRVTFPDRPGLVPDDVTTLRWKDTWGFAVGAIWDVTDKLTLRFGAAYDESPVPDELRNARLADSNRYWLAFGIGYQISEHARLDIGYAHIWADEVSVNLDGTEPGNALRGAMSADYNATVDLVAVGATLTF